MLDESAAPPTLSSLSDALATTLSSLPSPVSVAAVSFSNTVCVYELYSQDAVGAAVYPPGPLDPTDGAQLRGNIAQTCVPTSGALPETLSSVLSVLGDDSSAPTRVRGRKEQSGKCALGSALAVALALAAGYVDAAGTGGDPPLVSMLLVPGPHTPSTGPGSLPGAVTSEAEAVLDAQGREFYTGLALDAASRGILIDILDTPGETGLDARVALELARSTGGSIFHSLRTPAALQSRLASVVACASHAVPVPTAMELILPPGLSAQHVLGPVAALETGEESGHSVGQRIRMVLHSSSMGTGDDACGLAIVLGSSEMLASSGRVSFQTRVYYQDGSVAVTTRSIQVVASDDESDAVESAADPAAVSVVLIKRAAAAGLRALSDLEHTGGGEDAQGVKRIRRAVREFAEASLRSLMGLGEGGGGGGEDDDERDDRVRSCRTAEQALSLLPLRLHSVARDVYTFAVSGLLSHPAFDSSLLSVTGFLLSVVNTGYPRAGRVFRPQPVAMGLPEFRLSTLHLMSLEQSADVSHAGPDGPPSHFEGVDFGVDIIRDWDVLYALAEPAHQDPVNLIQFDYGLGEDKQGVLDAESLKAAGRSRTSGLHHIRRPSFRVWIRTVVASQ